MSLPEHKRQNKDGWMVAVGLFSGSSLISFLSVCWRTPVLLLSPTSKRLVASAGIRPPGGGAAARRPFLLWLNSSQIHNDKMCDWILRLELGRSRLHSPVFPADFIAINSCASRPPVVSSAWRMKQSPLFLLSSHHLLLFKHPSVKWGTVIILISEEMSFFDYFSPGRFIKQPPLVVCFALQGRVVHCR